MLEGMALPADFIARDIRENILLHGSVYLSSALVTWLPSQSLSSYNK